MTAIHLKDSLALGGALTSLLIFAPWVIFLTYKLHGYRQNVLVHKRHYPVLFASNLFSIFVLLIGAPLAFMSLCNVFSPKEARILRIFGKIVFGMGFLAWGLCSVFRFYFLMYASKMAVFSMNDEWRAILNPSYLEKSCIHFQWYYHHKSTFGSYRKVGQVLALLFLLFFGLTLSYILTEYEPLFYVVNTVLWLFPMACIVIIYFLVPDKFFDNLFLRAEMRYLFLTYMAIFTIFASLYWALTSGMGMTGDDQFWWEYIWKLDVIVTFTCVTTSTSGWLCYKIHTEEAFHCSVYSALKLPPRRTMLRVDQSSTLSVRTSTFSSPRMPSVPSASSPHLTPTASTPIGGGGGSIQGFGVVRFKRASHARQSLRFLPITEFLKQPKGYLGFMHHLIKEFSTENLLAYTEIVQYKRLFKHMIEGTGEYVDSYDETVILRSQCVPVSGCIGNVLDVKNWREYDKCAKECTEVNICSLYNIGIEIFHKYIEAGKAPYEINIPSSTRKLLTGLFWMAPLEDEIIDAYTKHDEEKEYQLKLYQVFDKCLKELRNLMMDSFSRYTRTPAYQNVLENMKNPV